MKFLLYSMWLVIGWTIFLMANEYTRLKNLDEPFRFFCIIAFWGLLFVLTEITREINND